MWKRKKEPTKPRIRKTKHKIARCRSNYFFAPGIFILFCNLRQRMKLFYFVFSECLVGIHVDVSEKQNQEDQKCGGRKVL